jgi:AraC-like DNA-binding protein
MDYTIRESKLPTFFSDRNLVGKSFSIGNVAYVLGSTDIKALHYHDMFEIGICISGTGECHIGDRVYRYVPGCIQIVPPGLPHLARSDKDVQSLWKWTFFDGVEFLCDAGIINLEDIIPIVRKAKMLSGVFTRDELGNIANAIDIISECDKTSDEYTNISVALAIGSFLALASRWKEKTFPYDENKEKKHRLTGIIEFVSEHLDSPDLIAEDVLAKKYSMGVSNFRRVFKLYCGMSPKAFILRSRMAYAEYLLRKTDLSVSEISSRIGYSEVSGFNRAFKKVFLLSPRALREITKKENKQKKI